jgi:hypothetical protein
MFTEKDIIAEEKKLQDIKFRINYFHERSVEIDTKLSRKNIKNEKDYSEYQKAVDEFHSIKTIWEYFNENNAFTHIKNGHYDWISQGILYLEVDPYYFRSGYFKEEILEALKSAPLTSDFKTRIQKLMIAIIKKCFRRELKYYGKLAKAVSDDTFVEQIRFLMSGEAFSPDVIERAKYIYSFLTKR